MSKPKFALIVSMLTIMWAFVTSCNSGHEGEPFAGKDIFINITLLTASAETRADALHGETGSEYTALEEGIDTNDLGIFLYVRKKKNGAEEKLLLKVINMESSGAGTFEMNGGDGQYRLNFRISQEEFEALLKEEPMDDLTTDIEFRMAVLANCSGFGEGIDEDISKLEGDTFAELVENAGEWSYDMNWLYDPDGGVSAEELYGNTGHKSGLPMFGVCKATISRGVLIASSKEQVINLGQLSMLRALAKVRVVDNIQHKTAGFPKITGVSVRSSRGFARPLPSDAASYLNGQQVHSTNPAPNPDGISSFLYTLGTIPDFMNMTPATSRTGNTYIGYLPEQAIYAGTNAKPVFVITLATDWDEDGNAEIKEYEVPMVSYNGTEFGFGKNILRNHIYTLSVTGLQQEELVVVANFTPWKYNRAHIEI